MRQMLEVIEERLLLVVEEAGYSAGDAIVKDKAADKVADKPENKPEDKSKGKSGDKSTDKTQDQSKEVEQQKLPVEASEKSVEIKRPKGAWIQVLGDEVTQKDRQTVPGYRSQVLGIIIGKDVLFGDRFTFGLAGGYQHADVNSRGPSGSYLDIKRFQGTAYAGYNFVCPFFIHGALTGAGYHYDSQRHILVPPFGGVPFVRIAQADFSAWEFNGYIESGYIWQKGNFRAIPKIMLMYDHLSPDDYFENDAFGLDLNVEYDDINSLPLGAGIKFNYINQFASAFVVPEMHAYVFHDFNDNKSMASATFTGGGFEFLSQGAQPAKTTFELGLGLAVHSAKKTAVTMHYDYVERADYHRHQAFIKVRHEWV
jgi:outer membrane autotransporter protein